MINLQLAYIYLHISFLESQPEIDRLSNDKIKDIGEIRTQEILKKNTSRLSADILSTISLRRLSHLLLYITFYMQKYKKFV